MTAFSSGKVEQSIEIFDRIIAEKWLEYSFGSITVKIILIRFYFVTFGI